MLVSYSKLLNAVLAPPPTTTSQFEPEWKQHLEWINILAQNIMAAANDLRPVQARGNLELMMRRQLELRREETKAVHAYVPFSPSTVEWGQQEIDVVHRSAGNATHWRRSWRNSVQQRRGWCPLRAHRVRRSGLDLDNHYHLERYCQHFLAAYVDSSNSCMLIAASRSK